MRPKCHPSRAHSLIELIQETMPPRVKTATSAISKRVTGWSCSGSGHGFDIRKISSRKGRAFSVQAVV